MVVPVKVLLPETVHIPTPFLVKVPLVVPRILDKVPLPDPPIVKPKVAPVIVPELAILISP